MNKVEAPQDTPPPFTIGGETIAPGTQADVGLPITTMATGFNSQLAVRVLHGAKPGPTVFLSAAIHGDEIVGTAIIQRIANYLSPETLSGTVMLVPVANIFGFLAHTRYLPDRRDLNRSFPGNASGSLAGQALRQIIYTRTENGEVKPALFLRLIFREGVLENRSWRGVMMLLTVLLGMGLLSLWVFASLWSLSAIDQALTLRQLASSVLVVFLAWVIWRGVHQPWVELVDNRVVKAPAQLLSFKEDSAELEMYRDDEKRPWTRFVRFSSDCPFCGGRILLAEGRPDHQMPLVGRCGESPHAHVFSFDRARLSGVYIGPRLQA